MIKGLIIDDNRATADALKKMLESFGLTASASYGSSSAMEWMRRNIPDFVLLDINMPGVDGIELLSFIRREPRLLNAIVFVVTSDDQKETHQRALKHGARQVLLKPVTLEMLEAALRKEKIL